MENKKLNQLLNKVVEYNEPNVTHLKGFLYKDKGGRFYIKIIEVLNNMNYDVGERLYLNLENNQEEFITHAEKPKLMRVSLNSWHYRLVKYVLGRKAPTPRTMQNGCPYFWLLIFSLIAVPFLVIGKLLFELLMVGPNLFFKAIDYMVDNWMLEINDDVAYDVYMGREYVKIPLSAKMAFKDDFKYFDDGEFIRKYVAKKYGITDAYSDEYNAKIHEMKTTWLEWRKVKDEEQEAYRQELMERNEKAVARRNERLRKQAELNEKWEKRMKPIYNGFNKLIDVFTIDLNNWKQVIKVTKRIVGGIISVLLLAALYIVVVTFTLTLNAIIEVLIQYWEYAVGFIIGLGVIGLMYGLVVLVTSWLQGIVNKYKNGRKVWYVEPMIYLGFYPLKYALLGITFVFVRILWTPIKFLFYTVIWKTLLINIWKGFKSLGRGIVGSTGIFGEYFNASYTDYCPGIEWVDTDENE